MKKKKFLCLAIMLACLLSTSACGSSENKLTENSWLWENSRGDETLQFFSDGTYDWGGWGSGTYSVKDDTLKLDRKYMRTYIYKYEISGDELKLYQQDETGNVFSLEKID